MFANQSKTKTRQTVEVMINFSLILVYPLIFISYGLDFTDSPWNIRMSADVNALMPYWLTAKIGHWWTILFGDSMISYRLLGYSTILIALVIIYFAFFNKKNLLLFSRLALATTIIVTSTTLHIFNYGVTTVLFLLMLYIGLFKFTITRNVIFVALCGFLSAFAMLARFPNIVVVPVIFVLLGIYTFVVYNKPKGNVKNSLLYLLKLYLVYFSAFALGVSLFVLPEMSLHDFVSRLAQDLSPYAQSENYHSIGKLGALYFRDTVRVIKHLYLILIPCIVFIFSYRFLQIPKWILGVAVSLFYMYYVSLSNTGMFNWGYSLNISALALFIILILLFTYYNRKKYIHFYLLLALGVFLLVPAFGSNTGLLKVKSLAVLMIPLLYYWISREKSFIPWLRYFVATLLVSLVIYGIYNRTTWFYGESKNIIALKHTIDHEKLKSIRTTQYRKELVETIIKEVNIHQQDPKDIVFFGGAGQLFYYILSIPSLPEQLFYLEPYDNRVIAQLETLISKGNQNPLIVILFGSANRATWPQYLNSLDEIQKTELLQRSQALISMLTKYGYANLRSDHAFVIYGRIIE